MPCKLEAKRSPLWSFKSPQFHPIGLMRSNFKLDLHRLVWFLTFAWQIYSTKLYSLVFLLNPKTALCKSSKAFGDNQFRNSPAYYPTSSDAIPIVSHIVRSLSLRHRHVAWAIKEASKFQQSNQTLALHQSSTFHPNWLANWLEWSYRPFQI